MGKIAITAAAVGIAATAAAGSTAFQTSYRGEVVRVIDGDTVEVEIDLLPGLTQRVAVRERNLDTPEKRRGRFGAQCEAELELGKQVSALVAEHLPPGSVVGIRNISLGKYAGRAVGDILLSVDGEVVDLGFWLISLGLGVPYDGGTKRKVWCDG